MNLAWSDSFEVITNVCFCLGDVGGWESVGLASCGKADTSEAVPLFLELCPSLYLADRPLLDWFPERSTDIP